jgi:5-methyltetrahydropteroyltriglutamate--homocysteine methyltransferase
MISTSVGNYPKVAEGGYGTKLIGTLTKWQRQELSDQHLEQTFQEISRAIIKEQEDAGLDLLTDGQIRWEDLVTPIAKRVIGFEINGLTRWFNNNVYYRRPVLHKAPKRRGPILVDEYRFAAGCTRKPVKMILPGPYSFVKLAEDRHYKSERPFALKMAEILNEEARALADAGCPFIQFDEPALGFGESDVKLAIDAIGIASRGVQAKTALYTYFGSLNGALGQLMRAKVDVIGVDVVSDPRTMAAIKRTKITKELALGCLDGRNTKLESVTELHALIDLVGKQVPLDRLYVNPNCGLEFLPHTQALAKLKRLSQAVRSYQAPRRGT